MLKKIFLFKYFTRIQVVITNTHKRAEGIEPSSLAWKAKVLPLNYARDYISILQHDNIIHLFIL